MEPDCSEPEPMHAPQRDDPVFGGDYDLYRNAYKAWHARQQLEDGRRKKKQCASHPKPRGKAPLADGVACTWDEQNGYWLTASGAQHDGAPAVPAFHLAPSCLPLAHPNAS